MSTPPMPHPRPGDPFPSPMTPPSEADDADPDTEPETRGDVDLTATPVLHRRPRRPVLHFDFRRREQP